MASLAVHFEQVEGETKVDQVKAQGAIITVGTGRGFVVSDARDPADPRLVITAAHCLPFFPPCASSSHTEERTYQALLAPLGAEPTVWAECLSIDPIADIAVLGPLDNQVLAPEASRYEELIGAIEPLGIADAPASSLAWVLSTEGRWFQCFAEHTGGPLWLSAAGNSIAPGMSGSPIIADDGSAIGIVCTGSDAGNHWGPQARLACHLPVWFWPRLP